MILGIVVRPGPSARREKLGLEGFFFFFCNLFLVNGINKGFAYKITKLNRITETSSCQKKKSESTIGTFLSTILVGKPTRILTFLIHIN